MRFLLTACMAALPFVFTVHAYAQDYDDTNLLDQIERQNIQQPSPPEYKSGTENNHLSTNIESLFRALGLSPEQQAAKRAKEEEESRRDQEEMARMMQAAEEQARVTKANCSGNGWAANFSSSPTKGAISRSLCRHFGMSQPADLTEFACSSLQNGFYKCFVSTGSGLGRSYKVRLTDGEWKIYGIMNN